MVLLVFPNLSKITLFEWVIIIVIKLSTLISRNNTCTVNHWKSSTSCPGVNTLPLLFRSPSWDWPLQSEWTWWTTRWNWDSPSHWDKTLTSQLRCSLFHFHVHLGDSYIIWNGWHILFFKLMSFFFQINSSGVCNVKYFKCDCWPDFIVAVVVAVCFRLQSGPAAEPGLLLPAALLRPRQAGHHRLDTAVPARTPAQPGCSQRPGLTNQGAPQEPRTKGTEYYILLLWEEQRSTKTAAALCTTWTKRSEARITHGHIFVGWKGDR